MPRHAGVARRLPVLMSVAIPTVKAAHWLPVLASMLVGYAMLALPAMISGPSTPSLIVILLRLAMLCTGLGVGFAFDDPSRPSTAIAPSPAWLPLAVRVAALTVAAAAWWWATLATGHAAVGEGATAQLPTGDLTLEAATALVAAIAVATVVWRRAPRGVVGLVAAPAYLVVAVVVTLLPGQVKLLVGFGAGGSVWAAAHDRCAVALAVCLVIALIAATWQPRALRRAPSATAGR